MTPQSTTAARPRAASFSTTLRAEHRGQRGIAIITVLSVLLLMTVLILAFFKMAQSELTDAKHYSETVRTRQLSEVVTNLVIGQIREATRTDLGGNDRYTWASQPGAITQFSSNFQSGTEFYDLAFQVYKLYSNRKMVEGVTPGNNLAFDVPEDWDERPARYVDLNEPVYNSTQQRLYFPIIDPRGYGSRQDGINANSIEGFSYSKSNSRNKEIAGIVEPGSGGGADKQRLPMPVEWLYMLADGTLGTLDDDGAWISPSADASKPTERNPISARVAFWTDDESSKININVASEGAFWDLPRADTRAERDFGRFQPARNEVYRYPGHVSGISLSPIIFPGSGARQVGAKPFLSDRQYDQILALSPKVTYFEQGSRRGDREAATENGTGADAGSYAPGDQRLYATVDELLYSGNAGGSGYAGERPLNEVFQNERTREFFEYGRHSLTVHSNAPEITLFGTPRVCLWPMVDIAAASNKQTYYDRLIAFSSNIGTKAGTNLPRRYYWQRTGPGSRHAEHYNRARKENSELLEQYMFQLGDTPIPGYGGSFFRKYGSGPFKDGQQIMIQIWDGMRNTNMNDPLLPASLHYYRVNGSIRNKAIGPSDQDEGYRWVGRGQIAGSCRCGGTGPHQQVWWQTLSPYGKGHGRVYTLSEACMVMYCRGVNQGGGGGLGDRRAFEALDSGKKLIEIGLLLESFCVSKGFRTIQPNQRMVVAGSFAGGNINSSPSAFPKYFIDGQQFPPMEGRPGGNPAVCARWDNAQNYVGKRAWGGHGGVRLFSADLEGLFTRGRTDLFNNADLQEDRNTTLAWKTNFVKAPGASEETIDETRAIILDETATTMMFQGSPDPMAVVLYDEAFRNGENVNNLIQVFELAFDHPDPSLSGQPFRIPAPVIARDGKTKFVWEDRVKASGKQGPDALINQADVTRSLIPAHGDFRLISGRRVGNKHIWVPHPDFGSATERHAHTLTAADGTKLLGYNSKRGYAIDKNGTPLSYPKDIAPDFPGNPDSASFFPRRTREAKRYALSVDPGVTGDWDQGLGAHPDGPYINRPDDGVQIEGTGDPYFDDLDQPDKMHRSFFAPNRVIVGAGQLGSIPTGIQAEIPWRTLLFRPDAEHYGARNYPRVGDPPDHVMMDFFWMPLVEPFPISQPFATMGKVNMNYRIVPFDYINRATALHGVMKDQRMMAIENGEIDNYKKRGGNDYRYPIDIPTTLLQFEDRFNKGEVFRSATEICEIYMIPRKTGAPKDRNTLGSPRAAINGARGLDYPTMRDFWKEHALTGDNSKERTYANIYPRLTTKSNVFQTHMIVESILKARSVPHDVFDPERDKISGRWRGSAVIERNINPDAIKPGPNSVPDYFTDHRFSRLPSMEEFYTYRVLNIKQFNP